MFRQTGQHDCILENTTAQGDLRESSLLTDFNTTIRKHANQSVMKFHTDFRWVNLFPDIFDHPFHDGFQWYFQWTAQGNRIFIGTWFGKVCCHFQLHGCLALKGDCFPQSDHGGHPVEKPSQTGCIG